VIIIVHTHKKYIENGLQIEIQATKCVVMKTIIIIIIISLCPHCWSTGLPYESPTRRTDHSPPRAPSADWWVLMTANSRDQRLNVPTEARRSTRQYIFGHPFNDRQTLLSFRDRDRDPDRGAIEPLGKQYEINIDERTHYAML
jgi:hypothetical protein